MRADTICSCGQAHYEDAIFHTLTWPLRVLRVRADVEVQVSVPADEAIPRYMKWPPTGDLPEATFCEPCWGADLNTYLQTATISVRDNGKLIVHAKASPWRSDVLQAACGQTLDAMSLVNFAAKPEDDK